MNHSAKRVLVTALIGAALPASSFASFTLFDNFNNYTSGSTLIGQGPVGNTWGLTLGSPTGMVVAASSLGGNSVFGGPGTSAAFRGLGALTIPNASTAATAFFQFQLTSTTNNNWNFVLTDTAPVDTAGSSEVQFNLDTTAGNFRARNAAAFKNLSIDGTAAGNVSMVVGAKYSVWFEINNSADNYRVYMQSDTVGGINTRTQVFANDGTGGLFGFRNGTAANDLINVNFGPGSGQPISTLFDNIFIDTAGFNALTPVPEPSTWSLLFVGASLVGLARRRFTGRA